MFAPRSRHRSSCLWTWAVMHSLWAVWGQNKTTKETSKLIAKLDQATTVNYCAYVYNIYVIRTYIHIHLYIYIQIANWSPIFQCKQLKTLFSPALIINHHPSWIYLSIRKGPEENPRTLGELAISDLAWTPDVQADSYKVVPPSYKLVYKRH